MNDVIGDGETNVAIACQGGGSHTAFTAGVLRGLFEDWDPDHQLVGISGSSGGAVCATAAWYGLLADDEDPRAVLASVWDAIAASDPGQWTVNEWVRWGSRFHTTGAPIPEVSPYQNPATEWGRAFLRDALLDTIDFDAIPDLAGPATPELVVGTVDIEAGEFETFTNGDVTATALLASAAVPDMFQAVEIDGDYHWDGLFSQNPPVDDLLCVDRDRKPDELWIVQINPQERDGKPTSMVEIKDRRNELAGNLSLNQELRFVRRVNRWIEEGRLPEEQFSKTEIRRIVLGEQLEYSSKLDRSPDFLADLIERGERRATEFRRSG